MTSARLLLLLPVLLAVPACFRCENWSPSTGPYDEAAEEAAARRERLQSLQSWIENSATEIADDDGHCMGWLDVQACNFTFRLRAPLRLRSPAPPRIDCARVEDVDLLAGELGMAQGLAERPRDHECWLRDRRSQDERDFLLVLHDRATGRYGIHER